MNKLFPGIVAPLALALGACTDSADFDFEADLNAAREQAVAGQASEAAFDPSTGAIPFPNNLLFGGSLDGTLNIPLDEGVDASDISNPTVALNALDGFSTTEAITTSFSDPIDPESAVLGDSVRVFALSTDATGTPTGVAGELTSDDVVVSVPGGTTLAISPIRPLAENTTYMMLVTSAVTNLNGVPSSPSSFFRLVTGRTELVGEAAALEPVRLATRPLIELGIAQGIPAASVIQAWSMKTQSIRPVLQAVKDQTVGSTVNMAPTGLTTNDVNAALPGIADVLIGTIDLPYYLTAPANPNDPAGISSNWTGPAGSNLTAFNTLPELRSTQTVPVLMTVPNAASGQTMPDSGWPITIFVHGITSNRTVMLAIADAMAQAGHAVIAIDQPMHGIAADNPLSATASPFPTDVERTFGIDLANNDTGAPGPDGIADSSGTHFYSPQFLLNARDNLRQSAADLFVLSASLDAVPGVLLDTSRKTVVGHSLGGTVSTTFLAFDDSVNAATLAMPAAGLARMLVASPAFGPTLLAGLSAAGLEQGTADFEQFLTAVQTVIDSGDAINFGAAAAANAAIHMTEIVGDGGDSLPDQTVPNNVPGAPLAGTDPLARTMGFDPLNPTSASVAGAGLVQFTAGDHGTILSPAASVPATVEMQTQTATFAATLGTSLVITDTSVIRGN